MPNYLTSSKYTDAKALWDSKTRVYLGTLPRNCVWNLYDTAEDPQQVRDIFDTNFYSVFIADTRYVANIPIAGYSSIAQYLIENDNIPVLIKGTGFRSVFRPNLTVSTVTPSAHPCYDQGGLHIGGDLEDPPLCSSFTSDSKYRFRDDIGDYINPPVIDNVHVFPLLPETIDLYENGDIYLWNNVTIYSKASITLLQQYGYEKDPDGVILDYEDFPGSFENGGGINDYFEQDARWASLLSQSTLNSNELYRSVVSLMMDRRLLNIENYLPWLQNERSGLLSNIYDTGYFVSKYMTFSSRISRSYGNRPRPKLNVYAIADESQLFSYTMNGLFGFSGHRVALYALINMHNFDAWVSAGLRSYAYHLHTTASYPQSYRDDPQSIPQEEWGENEGLLTISETIALGKFLMFSGSIKLLLYPEGSTPNQQFFSFLIAYDEMQKYHNFIKYGYNFVPEHDFNRFWDNPDKNPNETEKYYRTTFFSKDYFSEDLPENVWIACRTYNDKTMFYGYCHTLNTQFTMRTPFNKKVKVRVNPYGYITIA